MSFSINFMILICLSCLSVTFSINEKSVCASYDPSRFKDYLEMNESSRVVEANLYSFCGCDRLPDLSLRYCPPSPFKCYCDSLCTAYGDCCCASEFCTLNFTSTEVVTRPSFFCQNVRFTSILDNSKHFSPPKIGGYFLWYLVIATCPEDWISGGGQELRVAIQDQCVNATHILPPVSDKNTGFDYHNEYCAICNGVQREHVIRWEYEYVCSENIFNILYYESTENFTLSLNEYLSIYCILNQPSKASFNLLSTGQPSPPKRLCYPFKPPSCLDRVKLENITGTEWNQTYYQIVKDHCFGTTQTLVTHCLVQFELPFRNKDCAVCNGFPEKELMRFTPMFDSAGILEGFSVLLDINKDGLIVISTEDRSTAIQVSCSPTEIYDPVREACRSIELQVCFQTSDGATKALFVDGKCITCNRTLVTLNDSYSFSFHNSTAVSYESQVFAIQYTNVQGDPVICMNSSDSEGYVGVCNGTFISLNQSDLFSYIDEDSVTYGGTVYVVEFNNSMGKPVICVDFSSNGTLESNTTVDYYGYPVGFFILTYIGCSLSMIGCALVLLTYSLFKELRTLPSKILMNLAVAILITNILILLGAPVAGAFPDVVELCVALAILLHYFCLSQFSWMSIMSTEIARTFYQAHKMIVKDTKHFKRVLLTVYLIVGWSLPLLITVVAIAVNFSMQDLVFYGVLKDGTRGSCWINHVESAIVALIVPIAISLVYNAIMFVIVSLFLIHASRSQAKVHKTKNSNVSYCRLTVAMFVISGLTWGIGFIAILARASWPWYPFIILNSIQGFVIFMAFLFTRKVGKLYVSFLTCNKIKEASSSVSAKQLTAPYRLKDDDTLKKDTLSKTDIGRSDHIESTA